MAILRRDVNLNYKAPPSSSLGVTPGGSSFTPLLSGVPGILTAIPSADLFLDFNDGATLDTLGINLAGATTGSDADTFNLNKTYRKHSWVASGGFDGGGFMRMTWFTGMSIGFSPVWISVPGGFTPHYELKYQVRQSTNMVHAGSAVKLLRQINGEGTVYRMGTMEWDDQGLGGGQFQRLKWFYDGFQTIPPTMPNKQTQTFCVWDDINDPGSSCVPKGPGGLIDGNFHEFTIECDYRNPEASLISISIDGSLVNPSPHQLNPASEGVNFPFFPTPGSTYYISPFAEMYSCGQSGCQATINSGTYDVDFFSYTILP